MVFHFQYILNYSIHKYLSILNYLYIISKYNILKIVYSIACSFMYYIHSIFFLIYIYKFIYEHQYNIIEGKFFFFTFFCQFYFIFYFKKAIITFFLSIFIFFSITLLLYSYFSLSCLFLYIKYCFHIY